MIAEKLKPKTFNDKLIGSMIAKQVAKPYNKIRKVYGLKPVKDGRVRFRIMSFVMIW